MSTTYTLKLAVDKSRNRVVFAESDNDFAEALLCFLKVPLGSISRLCGKNTSIGSIDNLYGSVEDLDVKYFNTKPCKTMLLCPGIADKHLSDSLRIYDTSSYVYYCSHCSKNPLRVVPYEGMLCGCGREMGRSLDLTNRAISPVHLFRGNMRFLITDDMVITLSSTRRIMDLTCEHGDKIELQEISVGKEEIILLVRQAAVGKMPFTSVFVGEVNGGLQPSNVKKEDKSPRISPISEEKMMIKVKKEDEKAKGESKSGEVEKAMTVNLLVDKRNRKVLYAECECDFVDLLVSFLTFPFGLVVDILRGNDELVDIGSFSNLFDGVGRLSSTGLIQDPICKDMLMKPSLPPHFSVGTTLPITSGETVKPEYYRCLNGNCFLSDQTRMVSADSSCSYCAKPCSPLIHVDPKKRRDTSTESGFMEKANYMVTDDLVITPFCSISSFSLLRKAGFLQQCVEEKTFSIGPKEAKKLLQACLTSKTPLTDAFLL